MTDPVSLKRSLSLPLLVLYGLGTTIGAGIYALIGKVAGVAGSLAPVSFLLASTMAAFTALTFAELSARYPRAAGEALYVREAFASRSLSTLIGLLVVLSGLVSMAAMVHGFVGYLHQFIGIDRPTAMVLLTLVLGGIAAWGIAESVSFAALITLIEIGGLLLVIGVGYSSFADLPNRWTEFIPTADTAGWSGIFAGVMLAFYAYLGFEDMVNVAEEVQDVEYNLPRAILLTLGLTTVLYLALMLVAILSLPTDQLAASEAPLAQLYEYHTGDKAVVVSIIGMLAILNGALIQLVMASRVLYGLASLRQLPQWLSAVHPVTRTPLLATALATAVVLTLALLGGLASLARMTSLIVLIVFSMVNLSLWWIKRRDPEPAGIRLFPAWIPVAGFLVSIGLVFLELVRLLRDSG